MSIASPQVAPEPSVRGRGLVIAGSLMMVLSVVGGIAVFGLLGSRIGFEEFMRDVVIVGDSVQPIPGSIDFTVEPPLRGGSSSMAVGVAVDDATVGTPECTMRTELGEPVVLTRSPFDSTLLNGGSDYLVVSSARLDPGDYTAECSWPGEPSQSPMTARFTVGRTLDGDDLGQIFGPVLGMLAVSGVAALVFLVGLILLIVGLVKRSRSRRDGGGAPRGGVGQQWGGEQWAADQWAGQQYPQPPYPQQPYPQPGAAQPTYPPYPQPGAAQPTYPPQPGPQAQPLPPTTPPPSAPPSGWTVPPSKRPGSPDAPTWPTPPGQD